MGGMKCTDSGLALARGVAGLRAVWRKHGCHPAKAFVPFFVQLPVFIAFATGACTVPRK